MRIWMLVTALFIASTSMGQTSLPWALQDLLDTAQLENELIPLTVEGRQSAIQHAVDQTDGIFKYHYSPYTAVAIPANRLQDFAEQDGVQAIHFSMDKGHVLNDNTRQLSNVDPVHNGFPPLNVPYTGKNVVVGIIDTGIELEHPDFWNADSTTRIYRLWDQNVKNGTKGYASGYGYGTIYTNEAIDTDSVDHQDMEGQYGHGTHVAGIAAGNGQTDDQYTGMAPDAILVIIATNIGGFNWKSSVVDGVDYIFKIADSLGLPAVINVSLGSYTGPHDGSDPNSQLVDAMLLEKPGRSMTCALGNSGDVGNYHLGYDVTSDTSFTWFEQYDNAQNGGTALTFELWADTANFSQVHFGMGADLNAPYSSFGHGRFITMQDVMAVPELLDTIWNDTIHVASVRYAGSYSNEKFYLSCRVSEVDSANMYFRFSTTGEGRFDIWSTRDKVIGSANMIYEDLPSTAVFPEIARYKMPDKWSSLITAWGCSEHIIGVGNYTGRASMIDWNGELQTYTDTVGVIANTSSTGPTRDGRIKPDVVAPGQKVLSAMDLKTLGQAKSARPEEISQDGWHKLNSGTSMAAPAVAGMIALLLESCPSLTNAQIREMIIEGATLDQFTGNSPNNRYGYGKANVYGALMQSPNRPSLNQSDTLLACEVTPLFTNEPQSSYYWSTGETTSVLQASQDLSYSVGVIDENGCFGVSDTVQIYIDPYRIPSPTISYDDDLSLCAGESITLKVIGDYKGYEWSHDDDIDQFKVDVSSTDFYWVEVTDFDGCRAFSDTLTVSVYPSPPTPVITQGTDSLVSSIAQSYQWYLNDTILTGATEKTLANIQDTGYFSVETFLASGCSALSEEVFFAPVIPMGIDGNHSVSPLSAFPLPTTGVLNIQGFNPETSGKIQIWNVAGTVVYQSNVEHVSEVTLNTALFPVGCYHLQYQSDGQIQTLSFIKR